MLCFLFLEAVCGTRTTVDMCYFGFWYVSLVYLLLGTIATMHTLLLEDNFITYHRSASNVT